MSELLADGEVVAGESQVVSVGRPAEQAFRAVLSAQEQGVGVAGVDVGQGDLLNQHPGRRVLVEERQGSPSYRG